MCFGKFPLVFMGGLVDGLACADPGARTPIGASGNWSERRCAGGLAAANVVATIFGIGPSVTVQAV